MLKKLFIMLLAVFALTGCSEHGNVSTRAYLKAVSLDGKRLTLSFFEEEQNTITITAENIEKAMEIAELSIGKKIFTGHTELILLKNCNSLETLDFMLHEWKLSPSCIVAKSKFNGQNVLANAQPETLTGSIEVAQKMGLAPECDIITILGGLLDGGTAETAELSENGFIDRTELK